MAHYAIFIGDVPRGGMLSRHYSVPYGIDKVSFTVYQLITVYFNFKRQVIQLVRIRRVQFERVTINVATLFGT